MIVEIHSGGGFGGIAAAGTNASVDVDTLPTAMQQKVCDAFDPAHLQTLAKEPTPERASDTMTYEIVVTTDVGEKHSFKLNETNLPAEMLDLIDSM